LAFLKRMYIIYAQYLAPRVDLGEILTRVTPNRDLNPREVWNSKFSSNVWLYLKKLQ